MDNNYKRIQNNYKQSNSCMNTKMLQRETKWVNTKQNENRLQRETKQHKLKMQMITTKLYKSRR